MGCRSLKYDAKQPVGTDTKGTSSSLSPFFGHLRASVGAGVAVMLAPSVNLEITYSIPILKSHHDVIKPFQLGVGLSIS
jgi:outer membrane protein assembly factor BamA